MSISVEWFESVAKVSMDDGKVNAMTGELFGELDSVFDEAKAKARAVVLAGRPGCFSAGFNIKILQGEDEDARESLISGGAKLAHRLFTFPVPLVMAVTGHAFALGAVWLLCGDRRIGERGEYQYGLNETVLGEVLPPFGYEPALMRVPQEHQMEALVFSKIYDPNGAQSAGYLDEVVEAGSSVDASLAYAARLAELPTDAYFGNKMAVRSAAAERMRLSLGQTSLKPVARQAQ